MKKKTLAILFLGFMGLKSVANPVSPEEARQVAERFFRNLGAEDGTSMDVRRSPVALRSSRPAVRLITFAHLIPVRDSWWFRVTMPCHRW